MDGIFCFGVNWTSLIDRISDDIHNSSERFWSYRNTDRCSSIINLLTSDQSFGGIHSNGSNSGVAQMLRNLKNKTMINSLNFECIKNRWDFSFELDIDDSPNNLTIINENTCEICPFLTVFACVANLNRLWLPKNRLKIVLDSIQIK